MGIKWKAILVLWVCLLLSGCMKEADQSAEVSMPVQAQGQSASVELSILYSDSDAGLIATIEQVCKDFMKVNPDIVVRVENAGKGSYTETLKTKIALDEFPDIMEIQDPYMFYRAGKLGKIPMSVAKQVEDPTVFDGNVYGVPYYTTTFGMVYNKELFEKMGLTPPKTYDAFLQVCKILKEHGVTPLALGGSKEDITEAWINYFFQKDVITAEPDWQGHLVQGKTTFADKNMVRALREFQNLVTGEYILEDSVNISENQTISKLVNGEVAMYYTEPSTVSKILDEYPQAAESYERPQDKKQTRSFQLGWFFLPDAEGNFTVIKKTGMRWAVSKACMLNVQKAQAAERFLNFCYGVDQYRSVLKSLYVLPSTRLAVLYPAVSVQRKLLTNYRYANKSTSYLGDSATPESFKVRLYGTLYSVAANTVSIEAAVKQLDMTWKEIQKESVG